MSTRHTNCLGICIALDPESQESEFLSRALDNLSRHVEEAVVYTRNVIRRDRGGVHQGMDEEFAVDGVSILSDCGLPGVDGFHGFLQDFIHHEVNPATIPLIGLTQKTLNNLWEPPPLVVIPNDFKQLIDYSSLLHFLRLNKTDHIWQGSVHQEWFATYGSRLITYVTALFSGRFVDRNGTKIAFDMKSFISDAITHDTKMDAPQLAGAIVSVFVEFLGDALFRVPFYSGDVLAAYRTYADNFNQARGITEAVQQLIKDIQDNRVSQTSAPLLGLALNTPLPWALVSQGPIQTSLVADYGTRMAISKLADLDESNIAAHVSMLASSDMLDDIEADKSALEKTFTCFTAKVITKHLNCIFIPNDPSEPHCGRYPDDTGSLNPDKQDYADLVGKLTKAAGTTAEKTIRSIVGALIRGVSIAALQNEVIAEVVASLAGTLAKKSMEHIMYTALVAYISDNSDPVEKKKLLEKLSEGLALLKG